MSGFESEKFGIPQLARLKKITLEHYKNQ